MSTPYVICQCETLDAENTRLREENTPGYWRNCHDIAEKTNVALRSEIYKLREQRDRLVEACHWAQQELLMHDEDCGGDFNYINSPIAAILAEIEGEKK